MKQDLNGAVVVVTGASAGIGRATALRLAKDGACVVAAARRSGPLADVVAECENRGARALAVPTDMTDENAVQALADQAVQHFGRIDAWVNNAAVSAFGRFEETPPDVFRRVIETNLFGYIHGARAALPRFREQGHGTLINVSSVVGVMGQAYTTAYTTSKWAIQGFSESLRGELSLDEAKDIHVCTVLPAPIDTPLFQSAANFTGRAARPLRPVYSTELVADAIVSAIRRPRQEFYVGTIGRLAALQHTITPGLAESVFARQVDQNHFQRHVQEPTRGNLFEPAPEASATVEGGWDGGGDNGNRAIRLASAGAVVAGSVALLWSRRRRQQSRA